MLLPIAMTRKVLQRRGLETIEKATFSTSIVQQKLKKIRLIKSLDRGFVKGPTMFTYELTK